MENSLLILFENAGLINNGKPVRKNIRKLTAKRIIDLCDQSSEISSYDAINRSPSIFSHAVSPSLGGDRTPCGSPSCRLAKVRELTQFAALYSDMVYIKNFFYEYTYCSPFLMENKAELIRSFGNDLTVFCAFLPLIEAGKLKIVTFRDICPHCLSVDALQKNAKAEYEKASQELQRRYYKEITYSLSYDDDEFALVGSGPDSLIPHGLLFMQYKDPNELLTISPNIIRQAKKYGRINLTETQAKKIKAGNQFFDPIINNIAFELGAAHFMDASFLSDSNLEIRFISNLTSDPVARRRTSLMQQYLTCLVPFIESVDTSALLKLREHEEEAFLLFRAALANAIEEYKTFGDNFSEKDAKLIYADIIQPKLVTLDNRIRNSNRDFINKNFRKLMGWTGAISVGIYASIFTESAAIIGATALGSLKAGAEIIESIMTTSDKKETIRKDDFYFLWRVREMGKASNLKHP